MNAILQCLINIDVFANDLNNNYKLMKSLYSIMTTNIAQTASSSTIPLTSNSNLLQQSTTTTTSNNTNDIEIDDLSSNNSKQQVCLYK